MTSTRSRMKMSKNRGTLQKDDRLDEGKKKYQLAAKAQKHGRLVAGSQLETPPQKDLILVLKGEVISHANLEPWGYLAMESQYGEIRHILLSVPHQPSVALDWIKVIESILPTSPPQIGAEQDTYWHFKSAIAHMAADWTRDHTC